MSKKGCFEVKNKKEAIVISIFIFINAICTHYYASKYFSFGLVATILVVIGYFVFFSKYFPIKKTNWLKIVNLVIGFGFLLVIVYFFKIYPKETNGNDHWSDITAFWDYYLIGKNGWANQSHLGNIISSMPINLILAFPFYITNSIDYFSLFSFLALIGYLLMQNADEFEKQKYLLLILTSPMVFMEVAGRSNLLLNGVIVALSFDYFLANIQNLQKRALPQIAILMGFALAYRMAFIMPIAVLLSYSYFRRYLTLWQIVICSTIMSFSFILTFLPFIWGHLSDFAQHNPFIKQSKITIPQSAFVLAFSIIFGYFSNSKSDIYFYSILILFIAILVGCLQYPKYTTLLYNAMAIPFIVKFLILSNRNTVEF